PFLPLLLKVSVCIPDETAGGVLFERLNTYGRYRRRLCLASRRNKTTRLLTRGQPGRAKSIRHDHRSQRFEVRSRTRAPFRIAQLDLAKVWRPGGKKYQTRVRNLQKPANFLRREGLLTCFLNVSKKRGVEPAALK